MESLVENVMIELLNINCVDYMRTQPDKSFDLGLIDCPYGIGENGETNHTRGKIIQAKNYKSFHGKDKESPSKDYFLELFRITKNQIIFGANHFVSKIPFDSSCWIVWDKDNGNNDFADCELAWTSFKTAVRKFKYTWNGMIQQNMKNKEIRIHPTQKPVQLYKWLLLNYAKPGQRIFDSHGGSFSSAIAAHYFGCEYVGCEIDEHYFKLGQERFKKETRQMSLF